jgi:hypothetical protein
MIDALTGAYNITDAERANWGKPPETNIGKLFSIYAGALRIVHEHSEKVLLWDDIDNASGRTLDRYGENFGVYRQGSPDIFYRLLIKVKMMAQLSGGDINTVLNAAATLLGAQTHEIGLEEVFPAKIWIYVDKDQLTVDTVRLIPLIWEMLHRIVAAGVWIRIVMLVYVTEKDTVYPNAGSIVYPRVVITPPRVGYSAPDKSLMAWGQMVTVTATCAPRIRM